ncbi:hypothetical protein CDAR_233001 [Caerostris darwini]|uniref:Uncharacterized protein n=1 Tax=Caerostris darwini TaxID=1538125 RepID=A0AAV4Q2J5_9ARAC|nr:hypothetical protein CDAR_233001 [Caerostris darwini]
MPFIHRNATEICGCPVVLKPALGAILALSSIKTKVRPNVTTYKLTVGSTLQISGSHHRTPSKDVQIGATSLPIHDASTSECVMFGDVSGPNYVCRLLSRSLHACHLFETHPCRPNITESN